MAFLIITIQQTTSSKNIQHEIHATLDRNGQDNFLASNIFECLDSLNTRSLSGYLARNYKLPDVKQAIWHKGIGVV
jgi:hypothetical protein